MAASKTPRKGIYYRGPNQYQVKIRVNGAVATRTFETLAEAEKWRTIQKGKIVGDEFVDTRRERRTALREVLHRYLTEETPKKKGARQNAARIRAWMASDLADYALAAVETRDISTWIAARSAEGKAPSTVSNAVNTLSSVFKKAREWGYNVDNPCKGATRPTPRPARFARLTPSEQDHLLTACEAGPFYLAAVVRLALTTAMRQGEIRALRWEHIHLDQAWLHVSDPKNGEARDVPLTHAAEVVLTDMRANLPHRLDGWVFGDPSKPSRKGGFTDNQVQQAYADAVKRAVAQFGIPKVTFHDLRHVACTALAKYHKDVVELQRTTGHKTLAVLAKYLNETAEEMAATLRERERRHQRKAARSAAPNAR